MDKGYEKEPFAAMKVKVSVAKKFRRFSKTFGKSQSLTLLAMMDFFERHGISPDQHFGETIVSMKLFIKRRFNAMVAIMRSIEKEQTLPTVSMMQALFQQELDPEEGDEWEGDFEFFEKQLTEINTPSNPELLDKETTVPKIVHERLKEQLVELKEDFAHVLDHVSVTKNRFGKDHLKVDLKPGAIEQYRTKLKNL
ncbi:BfmA/BtgA family mobilization protein [Flagellimonas halotolerans]|uniref:BfmA/BtgA family mobilization protein n=1 Tax=Flagellimonas halotolerans TaxID=3112164 RepID=A0ABU6IQV6_9FLAO|nr:MULTISPECIES: BfmA/BtgA family mobilization protein [unclassified Allomuricauda]MEC3965620.1 BfmA/BtgA family mobilization protein [Muricauda sp. SYSU M86414]MEC4265487.1 BfmA/BtgA family mobilization protein [Muricauda sp. SYSU M84420]